MTCLTCQAAAIADEDGLHRLIAVQRAAIDLAGNEVLALTIENVRLREERDELLETVRRLNARHAARRDP